MSIIDLRSDTVTTPSVEMREAMCKAEVGDDVYVEDPTVKELEKRGAEICGKEAAIYTVSGTMGNIVALMTHEIYGKGVLVGHESHIVNYEGGGISSLAGGFCQQVNDDSGLPLVSDMEKNFRLGNNIHFVETKLLCLENTHNRRGGMASTVAEMKVCSDWARERGIKIHLDGARLFNAAAACGEKVSEFCSLIDSVQICLSKGLGAPMGSLICGTKEFVDKARYFRKKVGGALRQVGIVAAAGLYALEHNISLLSEDNEKAAMVKKVLEEAGFKTLPVARPTNMIYFSIKDASKTDEYAAACGAKGIKFASTAPGTFRLVFHLDISREQTLQASNVIIDEAKRMGV